MTTIDRAAIEPTHGLIAPYIRATPVVETSGTDLGLVAFPIARAHIARVMLVTDAALRGGGYVPATGERAGVVVGGGNTPAVNFGR